MGANVMFTAMQVIAFANGSGDARTQWPHRRDRPQKYPIRRCDPRGRRMWPDRPLPILRVAGPRELRKVNKPRGTSLVEVARKNRGNGGGFMILVNRAPICVILLSSGQLQKGACAVPYTPGMQSGGNSTSIPEELRQPRKPAKIARRPPPPPAPVMQTDSVRRRLRLIARKLDIFKRPN